MREYIEAFEHYLLTQRRVARNTLQSYMLDVEQFVHFLEKNKLTLEEAREEELKSFFQTLRKQKHLAARSLSRKISSLKIFYAYLHEKFKFTNITLGVSYPKLEKKLPNFLTEPEMQQLLSVAEADQTILGKRNNLLLHLLYITGIRISEAVSIRLADIHLEERLIMVHGKGGKERLLPIPEVFVEQLVAFIQEYHATVLKKKTTEYLFAVKSKGRVNHMTRQAAWVVLKKIVQKSGIQKRVTPHTFRHSLATHLLEKGAHLRSLQVWLGHEHVSTVEIYTHVNTEHLRKIYDKKHPRAS